VLDEDARALARDLLPGAAGGNAVVVQQLLAERGIEVGIRAVQRAVAEKRREARVSQLATVRVDLLDRRTELLASHAARRQREGARTRT
jgi:hypothetical protein